MTQLLPSSIRHSDWLHIGIAAIVIGAIALLATAVLGGPGAGPSFDLTTDPIGALWTW